ncbi:MAG: hypothetical protein NTW08_02410 [Gammaproteobacteria bacterium]|nr:hypothetical protein [Gammaproteobacteria bacterium]
MKKLIALSLMLGSTHLLAQEPITTQWPELKPMVEGHRRVDEIMEWKKAHPGEMAPLTEQEKYLIFEKDGLPGPYEGVKLKSFNSMKYDSDLGATIQKNISQLNTIGYIDLFSHEAKNLSTLIETAKHDFEDQKSLAINEESTHLRSTLDELKLSFYFKEIQPALILKKIGFSPESSLGADGWNGVVEFFKPKSFDSICAYHEVSVKNTGTSAFILKETASKKVNDKITTVIAEGNMDSGFLYKINWWDDSFRHELDCVYPEYKDDLKISVIELAKKIDNRA